MSFVKLALIAALATLAAVGVYHHQHAKSTSTLSAVHNDALFAEFQAWKVLNNKPYGGAEEAKRFNIYKTNKAIIEEHNATATTYTVGINKFADLTNEEFSAIYLGFRGEAKTTTDSAVNVTGNPATVDWRGQTIGAVKNQAQCGSCWAFSTVAALEGLAAKNGQTLRLSEQQLVDCSKENSGCNGGLMDYAFDYVSQNGIATEAAFPYKGVDGKCKYTSSDEAFRNKGYTDVAVNNWQALETAVAQQVVSVAIEADRTPFQYYTGGVIEGSACGTELDHGVAVVGYTEDAWIVRNSWGASWGEQGHVRIAKKGTGAGVCGINSAASYPTA